MKPASESGELLLFREHLHPMLVFDDDTLALLDANRAAEMLYGYTREEFRCLTLPQMRPPEDVPSLMLDLAAASANEKTLIGRIRHRKKDGTPVDVEVIWLPFRHFGPRARVIMVNDISARVAAERRLAETAAQYRGVVDLLPVGVSVIRDGRFLYVNRELRRLIGLGADQALDTLDAIQFIHPECRASASERWQSALQRGVSNPPAFFRALHRDGSEVPVVAKSRAIIYDGAAAVLSTVREFRGVISGETDPGDHDRQYESAAVALLSRGRRDSSPEPELDLTFEQAAIGIGHVGMDRRWLRVNRRMAEMFGYRIDEMIGRSPLALTIPGESDAGLADDIARLIANPRTVVRAERRFRRRDGTVFRASGAISLAFDSRGQPTHYIIVAEDVEERHRALDALRQSEQRHRLLLETANDPIFVCECETSKLVEFNPRMRDLLGMDDDSMLGRRVIDLTPPEKHAEYGAVFRAAVRSGECVSHEVEFVRADGGRRWTELGCSVFRWHGRELMLCIVRDVTERRRLAEERIAIAERQRDALVREVHHRIKNHLQGVIGMLREQREQRPQIAGLVDLAIAQIGSIAAVHGLHGNLAGGDVALCELTDQIVRACAELERVAARPVERLEPRVRLAKEAAVPVALIINELVMNACKHSDRAAESAPLDVRVERIEDGAAVSVRNRVVPAIALPRLDTGERIGDGLSIALALVPRGGRLSAQCVDGEFEVRLALAPPALAAA